MKKKYFWISATVLAIIILSAFLFYYPKPEYRIYYEHFDPVSCNDGEMPLKKCNDNFNMETFGCLPDPNKCSGLVYEACGEREDCKWAYLSGTCDCPNCEIISYAACQPKV